MKPFATYRSRRGSILIELVTSVAILAIVVPTSVALLRGGLDRRADSIQLVRAQSLLTGLAEQITADACSPDPALGFSAFDDSGAYLDAPEAGFRDRVAGLSGLYETQGFSYTVEIGPMVDRSLAQAEDDEGERYRVVRLVVTAPLATRDSASVPLELVISEISR